MAFVTATRRQAVAEFAEDVRSMQRTVYLFAVLVTAVYGLVTGLQYSGGVTLYGGWRNGGIVLNSPDCGKAIGLEVWGHPGWFAPCSND